MTHNSNFGKNSDFESTNKLQNVNVKKSNSEKFVNYFGITNYYSDFLELHITT